MCGAYVSENFYQFILQHHVPRIWYYSLLD